FGEALHRVARYHSLWTDGATIDVEPADGIVRVVYRYLDPEISECRQDAEMTLAAVVGLGRRVTQTELSPIEVRFQHTSPADTLEHARIFRAPIRFGMTFNEVHFASSILALPIVTADSSLAAVLTRYAEELLPKYPRRDLLVERVRSVLAAELNGGNPSLG